MIGLHWWCLDLACRDFVKRRWKGKWRQSRRRTHRPTVQLAPKTRARLPPPSSAPSPPSAMPTPLTPTLLIITVNPKNTPPHRKCSTLYPAAAVTQSQPYLTRLPVAPLVLPLSTTNQIPLPLIRILQTANHIPPAQRLRLCDFRRGCKWQKLQMCKSFAIIVQHTQTEGLSFANIVQTESEVLYVYANWDYNDCYFCMYCYDGINFYLWSRKHYCG